MIFSENRYPLFGIMLWRVFRSCGNEIRSRNFVTSGRHAAACLTREGAAGRAGMKMGRPRPFLLLIAVTLLAVAADAEPSAPARNPLWKVSLAELSNTRERPIFSFSRRPPVPPPPPTHAAPVTVQPPVRPREAERPAVSLLGTVISSEVHIGVFLETATNNVVRLRVGEDHQGWVVRLIKAGAVTLVKDGEPDVVLVLPPPDKASGGPPRVATGPTPAASSENYVDEQPVPVRAARKR
jgi:general secretion pathway protein N